jgi:putative N-acetylmannosamine-6-phosphate epimerase
VLAAITNVEYIDETVEGYTDYEPGVYQSKDVIALVRSLVNKVSVI